MNKLNVLTAIFSFTITLIINPLPITAQNCSYELNLKNELTYEYGELNTTTISNVTPDHWEVKGTNKGPGLGHLEPVFDFSSCIVSEIYTGFYVNRTGLYGGR